MSIILCIVTCQYYQMLLNVYMSDRILTSIICNLSLSFLLIRFNPIWTLSSWILKIFRMYLIHMLMCLYIFRITKFTLMVSLSVYSKSNAIYSLFKSFDFTYVIYRLHCMNDFFLSHGRFSNLFSWVSYNLVTPDTVLNVTGNYIINNCYIEIRLQDCYEAIFLYIMIYVWSIWIWNIIRNNMKADTTVFKWYHIWLLTCNTMHNVVYRH